MFVRKISKFLLWCMVLGFVLSFGSNSVVGEEMKQGLSVDNVHAFYSAKNERLQVLFALLNTGSTDITVLVENLNTTFSDESDKQICEIGAGITAKYKDYRIIQSLYRFDPVTLRPKEGVAVNHWVKRRPKDIDPNKTFIVRYKINDDFGKRHNVWYGSAESAPTKLKIFK